MRIGVVTQWYPPEPVTIPRDVAHGLAARGHEVKVLTGFPNYPSGTIYAGFSQTWRSVTRDDAVTLCRVPLYPNHDNSGVRRAANYLSFAASSAVAGLSFLKDVDAIYVYLTPATVYAAPALLKLLRGIPSVLHVQDLWPESVTQSALAPSGGLLESALHVLLRRVYRSAAGVAAIAPTMAALLAERGARDVRTILNWADEDLFHPVPPTVAARTAIGHRDRCTIMYAGTMGPFQNLATAVRAAAAVDSTNAVDLILAGSGIDEEPLRELAADLGARNIRFLGRRPAAEMAALYSVAGYQLISLRDLPIFRGTIPSKLQAALACGSPVITAVAGDCATLVETHGLGLTAPPDDWPTLADRFLQAAKTPATDRAEMSRRARTLYRTTMSREAGLDQLENLLLTVGAP